MCVCVCVSAKWPSDFASALGGVENSQICKVLKKKTRKKNKCQKEPAIFYKTIPKSEKSDISNCNARKKSFAHVAHVVGCKIMQK